MTPRRTDRTPLWERAWVSIPLALGCLLVWWVVIAAVVKLWPR